VVAFKNREGANLYTASIVALNADTGKMVWYFQSSPHDTHDWDATQTAVVFDGTVNGQPRKLLAQASRNGKFFVLDRTNGKAIVSSEYIKTNWALGYDERGQPVPNPEKRPQIAGALVTPNQGGATNWFPPSFSPLTGLFYVNATRAFSVWYIYDASDNPMGWGGTDRGGYAEQPQLTAIDYKTGKVRWSIPRYGGNSGILTTAGNVLFNAAANGLGAYNATTGQPLWNAAVGANVTNGPITYELDGLQYVVAGAGARVVAFVMNQ
jgi:alcohol dehydrogenase (cytochrome c)